ncbi:MAG: TIGR00366 family protein [Flavobacteriales bacterium]|nr:TIGR00366 family protein [Flavobacteriales bacterium]
MSHSKSNSYSAQFEKVFKRLFPSPFSIAILLTLLTLVLAIVFQKPTDQTTFSYLYELANYWEKGIWNKGGMVFAFQMMLMLVLGYLLALSKPVNFLINKLVHYCNTTAKAAFTITFFTLAVSLFNWGFGLIFGAIFVKKVLDYTAENQLKIHTGILGASGYSGLMVWHGGLSGSAPIKAAEEGNILSMVSDTNITVPNTIDLSQTIFSSMNITVSTLLLLIVPLFMYFIGKKLTSSVPNPQESSIKKASTFHTATGIERLDYSKWFGKIIGLLILTYLLLRYFFHNTAESLNFITPNFINLLLIALVLLLMNSVSELLQKLEKAIGSSAGILIQFPLYFGIMGVMKESGLLNEIAQYFVTVSSTSSFPILTFFSAGLVNIFVPSGGGQWAVQGPVIIEASLQMGIPLGKSIMALAYGDQITNMLQPFWALPLLGITGLKAKDILPYTLLLMLVGSFIFLLGLSIF